MKFKGPARFIVAGVLAIAALGMVGVRSTSVSSKAVPTVPMIASPDSMPFLSMTGNKVDYGFHTSAGKWQCAESDQGKLVLLFFWATWCKPCEGILESLDLLWQQYQQTSVVVLTVALDTEPESILAFQQEKKINVPYAFLSQELITASKMVAGVPTLYILSPQGIVLKKREGIFLYEQLEDDIQQILAKP